MGPGGPRPIVAGGGYGFVWDHTQGMCGVLGVREGCLWINFVEKCGGVLCYGSRYVSVLAHASATVASWRLQG